MMSGITVQVVTFNSESWIESFLEGIYSQSDKNIQLVIIDNNSQDGTLEAITSFIADHNLKMVPEIISNQTNLGFATAHNQALQKAKSKYILVINPDIIMTPGFLLELETYLEQNPGTGAVCGKLLRMDHNLHPTVILDSTGIVIDKSRRAFDRGQGEIDKGQYNQTEEIFGCSGAAVLYRREMLEDIKIGEEYFDESFFAYKEDVDLAWRSQLRGWNAAYVPSAVAYHGRGWQPGKRHVIPSFVQIHSFQNRYLMLLKNEEWRNFLLHLPFIVFYELLAHSYILLRTPYLLKGWYNIARIFRPTLNKRNLIMRRRKTEAEELRHWFL